MGESRQDLLNWVNNLLQLNLTKVEQMGTGSAICQIFDSIYGDVPMGRVKFNVNTEYAYLANFKILQNIFKDKGIDRPLPIERLVKCKMQDNLEFLQWVKKYWDQHYPGGEYDAVARRKGAPGPTPSGNAAPRGVSSNAKRGTTPTVSSSRTRTPLGHGGIAANANNIALQNEVATLKESVVGLERERDFYFSKLRDIELLLQEAIKEDPELETNPDTLVPKIQQILYSTEEGFEIPDESAAVDELETF